MSADEERIETLRNEVTALLGVKDNVDPRRTTGKAIVVLCEIQLGIFEEMVEARKDRVRDRHSGT